MATAATALMLALCLATASAPAPVVAEPTTVVPEAPAADGEPEAPAAETDVDAPIDDAVAAEGPVTSEPDPSVSPVPDELVPPDDPDPEPPEDADDPFGDEADAEPWPDDPPADLEPDAAPLPNYDPLRDSPQALRARHWVRTGIGTLSAGGALLVGAIIMGASDPCFRPAGNSCQQEARNRAALVMGIPAAVLVGGGAAMLGVGLARRRALAVDLQASRHGVQLGLRGRF